MIPRILLDRIRERLFSGKTILVLGPRQSGKTTLLKAVAGGYQGKTIWMNADQAEDLELLNHINGTRAQQLFPSGSLVVVDEAQRLENSGLTLKIIHDHCPSVQLIATGSSAFELTDKVKEALTGRKWTFNLFPLSLKELKEFTDLPELNRVLETRMIFGSYPEVINRAGNEKEVLHELVSDYLYKDVFRLKDVRKPEVLEKLVKALAFQVGNQVSYRELSGLLQVDKETVERYITLLEEAYIIFRLPSFSSNLREELKTSRKIYFTDNGIRNAVINHFNPLSLRNDAGVLWENLMITERTKNNHYAGEHINTWFWRTTRQQEVDYLEEKDGQLKAFKFKWKAGTSEKISPTFLKTYPEAKAVIIDRNSWWEFLGL